MSRSELQETIEDCIRIRNKLLREALAEFLGTFVLVAIGCGSVAQFVLSKGGFLSVNWAWGLAVALGVYMSGGVSGGHLNPAVSLAVALIGRMPFKKVPVYWLAQYLGAFVAAGCVFGVYYDAISRHDGGVRQVKGSNATAGIFGTFPDERLSTFAGFGDQVFGTMMLMLCIMAVTDDKNFAPYKGTIPLCVGATIAAIGMSFGMNCGYAINPARDFSPRLFTAMAGYGSDVFTAYNYWFWVPIVAPHIGAILGAWMYLILVGAHIPDPTPDDRYQDKTSERGAIQNKAFQPDPVLGSIKINESARF